MELDDADADFDSLWDAELHRASEEVQLLPQGERQWDVLLSKFKKSKVKVSLETIKVMPDQSLIPLHFRRSSNVNHPPRDVILWRYDREKWAFLDADRAAIIDGPRKFIDLEFEEIEERWNSNPPYLWPSDSLVYSDPVDAEVEIVGGSPRFPSLPHTFDLDCRECQGLMPSPGVCNLYTRYDRCRNVREIWRRHN